MNANSTPVTSDASNKPRNTARKDLFLSTSQISVSRVQKRTVGRSWVSRKFGISLRVPAAHTSMATTITTANVRLIAG